MIKRSRRGGNKYIIPAILCPLIWIKNRCLSSQSRTLMASLMAGGRQLFVIVEATISSPNTFQYLAKGTIAPCSCGKACALCEWWWGQIIGVRSSQRKLLIKWVFCHAPINHMIWTTAVHIAPIHVLLRKIIGPALYVYASLTAAAQTLLPT